MPTEPTFKGGMVSVGILVAFSVVGTIKLLSAHIVGILWSSPVDFLVTGQDFDNYRIMNVFKE